MVRLMLLRHGKSDWNAEASGDRARPLNARGRRAATTMGIVLTKMGEAPDRVVSSPAVRAAATASLARISGGWAAPFEIVDDLYGAGPETAMAVAARCGHHADRLMLVGHEPTWSLLARHLTGGTVVVKTGTVLAFDLDIASWSDAARARGTLAYALHPRLFEQKWNLR